MVLRLVTSKRVAPVCQHHLSLYYEVVKYKYKKQVQEAQLMLTNRRDAYVRGQSRSFLQLLTWRTYKPGSGESFSGQGNTSIQDVYQDTWWQDTILL